MSVKLCVKLNKNGNSLRMTVPTAALWVLKWKEGDILELNIKEGNLVVSKTRPEDYTYGVY